MPRPLIDIMGQRFGRLLVIGRSAHTTRKWRCRCDCGNEKDIDSRSLRVGNTRSCGCLLTDTLLSRNEKMTKHGLSTTPEYNVWSSMIQRCTDTRCKSYPRYGGRGIHVCARWLESFEAFYEDMGPRPFPEAQIDRENNDGGYEPGNCRWVTARANALNRRPRRAA